MSYSISPAINPACVLSRHSVNIFLFQLTQRKQHAQGHPKDECFSLDLDKGLS